MDEAATALDGIAGVPRGTLRISLPFNREAARQRGIAPVISYRLNERNKPAFFARTFYKARARIQQGIGQVERFKRVAFRCKKTAMNFGSIVAGP